MMYEDSRLYSFNVKNAAIQYNGTFNSNVLFQIAGFVKRQTDVTAIYVSMESASIPSSWYIFNLTNNTLAFSLSLAGGPFTPYSLTMPPGTYDAYTIQTLLNNQLIALSITAFTFIYNLQNNKFGILWANSTPASNVVSINSTLTTMQDLIGLVLPGPDSIIYDLLQERDFTDQVNLSGVTTYFIQCAEIPVQNQSLQTNGAIMGSIQNAAGLWGLTLWDNTSQLKFMVPANIHIDQLTVRIYDQEGNLIDFNNQEWNMTMKVSYLRTTLPKVQHIIDAVDDYNTYKKQKPNPPDEQQPSSQPETPSAS